MMSNFVADAAEHLSVFAALVCAPVCDSDWVCVGVCEFAFAFTCRCRCRSRCLFACVSVAICVCMCAMFFCSLSGSA